MDALFQRHYVIAIYAQSACYSMISKSFSDKIVWWKGLEKLWLIVSLWNSLTDSPLLILFCKVCKSWFLWKCDVNLNESEKLLLSSLYEAFLHCMCAVLSLYTLSMTHERHIHLGVSMGNQPDCPLPMQFLNKNDPEKAIDGFGLLQLYYLHQTLILQQFHLLASHKVGQKETTNAIGAHY